MIPCFTKLIHEVVQNMQLTVMPLEPNKEETYPLMILKTKTTLMLSAARKAVIELEAKTRINNLHKNKGGEL